MLGQCVTGTSEMESECVAHDWCPGLIFTIASLKLGCLLFSWENRERIQRLSKNNQKLHWCSANQRRKLRLKKTLI